MGNNEDIILKDVLKGTTNTTEMSEIVKWLATNEGQDFLSNDIDESIKSLLQGDDSLFAPMVPVPSEKILARINHRIRFQKMLRRVRNIAAIVIPITLLAGFILYASSHRSAGKEEYTEIYVPKGEQKKIAFEDGTRAYLGSDTKLRYPKNFASEERKIYLEGEGYFMVEKNPDHPFIIEMNEAVVKVLGTSFNVEAYPESNNITVQLDEGSIKLTSSNQKEYLMVPGEKLTYNRKSGDCVITQINNTPLLKIWENQAFSFNNAPLREVLETLEHWYDVEFQTEDPNVWNYSYTFQSDRSSLKNILSDMEKVSPVVFQSEGKVIKISMK